MPGGIYWDTFIVRVDQQLLWFLCQYESISNTLCGRYMEQYEMYY